MSAIKEPLFCIVARAAKNSTTLGKVIKERLHEGQAQLLATRCNDADKDTSYWVLHHNDCLHLARDKFYTIPEGINHV